MLLLAAFATACGGFALLALGKARHAGAVADAPPRPRPMAAAALLGLSLGLAVLSEGWGFGILAWATLLTLAVIAVVAILAWRPRWLRPLLPGAATRLAAGRRYLLAALALGAAYPSSAPECRGVPMHLDFRGPAERRRVEAGAFRCLALAACFASDPGGVAATMPAPAE